jgi:phenylalanyl-tRNA synthetase beta chain
MRVSLSWIARLLHVPALPVTPQELQATLSLRLVEIEAGLLRQGPSLDGVVVGRVLTVEPHPNAERLRVTTVDVGAAAPLGIVCGAPNVAVGQAVAVATVGATVSIGGKPVEIKAAKLRGVPSAGMLCAEDELGLGAGHDGILVLPGNPAPGTPLATVLAVGDTVMVIENHGLTHRPDLWGHLGWAREIAAVLDLPAPPAPDVAWPAGPATDAAGTTWDAVLDDPGCTTYCGAVVEGLRDGPSPPWMRDLLEAAGVRPLSLLVDITNYVLMECGQPLHAFDRRFVTGGRLRVRAAAAGESLTTLDGRTLTLVPGDLVVADDTRALALAGVMGGQSSMVRADTTTIVLEGAVFRAERIRRTRQRTGLASDSSARFEKGLQGESAAAGINRALALILALCPDAKVTARFSAGALTGEARQIRHDAAAVARLTGLDIPFVAQQALLGRLGFAVEALSGDSAVITVPWWRRKDVATQADLVEEIARHHGYERIVPAVPRLPAAAPAPLPLRRAEHRARRVLSAQGFDEVATYAFTNDGWLDLLAAPGQPAVVRLQHPMSSAQTVMRPSLIPTLAEAVGRNRRHLPRVSLYEVGKRYGVGVGAAGMDPAAFSDEILLVAGMCAAAGDDAPVLAARDAALALGAGLGWPLALGAADLDHPGLSPTRTRALLHRGKPVGVVGELAPAVRLRADCPERVGYFAIELEALLKSAGLPPPVAFVPPSRFPRVEREFTWVCPETLDYGPIAEATRAAAGALAAGVELITIYRGDPIPAGHKAVSLRLGLQSPDKTLDERDVTAASDRVIKAVTHRTGAVLRA